jgi:hypothetical protein
MTVENATGPAARGSLVGGFIWLLLLVGFGLLAALGVRIFCEEWHFASRAKIIVGTVVAEKGSWRFSSHDISRNGTAAVRYTLDGKEYAATVSTKGAWYSAGKPIEVLVSPDYPGTVFSADLMAGREANAVLIPGVGRLAVNPPSNLSGELPPNWPKENSESVRLNSWWDRFLVPAILSLFFGALAAVMGLVTIWSVSKRILGSAPPT